MIDAIFALLILLFAALDPAGWLHGLPVPRFLIRATWWLLYLGVIARLFHHDGTEWTRWMCRRQPVLVALLATTILSSWWSLAPAESLRTSLSLTATTLAGVYLGYALPRRVFVRILSIAFAVVVLSSLAALPVLPHRIVVEPATGQWRGLMNHKNSFGAFAAFAVIFYAAPLVRRGVASPMRAVLCGACVVALVLSRSVTALLACGAGVASLAWSVAGHRVRRAPLYVQVVLAAVLAAGVVLTTLAIAPITRALGRDETFNGRTPLWAASLAIIRERPLTGYGYQAVWKKGEASLLPHVQETMGSAATGAHNSVLNIATEAGVPAAVLLIAYLISMFLDAARFDRQGRSALSLFVTASLVTMVTLNVAESYLVAVHSVQWILCVATAVMLRRSIDATRAVSRPRLTS
jgi:O-antigen ligase